MFDELHECYRIKLFAVDAAFQPNIGIRLSAGRIVGQIVGSACGRVLEIRRHVFTFPAAGPGPCDRGVGGHRHVQSFLPDCGRGAVACKRIFRRVQVPKQGKEMFIVVSGNQIFYHKVSTEWTLLK